MGLVEECCCHCRRSFSLSVKPRLILSTGNIYVYIKQYERANLEVHISLSLKNHSVIPHDVDIHRKALAASDLVPGSVRVPVGACFLLFIVTSTRVNSTHATQLSVASWQVTTFTTIQPNFLVIEG